MEAFSSASPESSSASKSVIAVCISRQPEQWQIPQIPFYCYTEGWMPFGREISKERVAYLAERRNLAVEKALTKYPGSTDILMIDSYYVGQSHQISGLVDEYAKLKESEKFELILGASTWVDVRTRVVPSKQFFDSWTTPEAINIPLEDAVVKGGILKVRAVGGCYIYPRWVWEKLGYGVPEDLHGCEHNWLCEESQLPVFLTLNRILWHDPVVYPWLKRIRCSLHLGRLLGR